MQHVQQCQVEPGSSISISIIIIIEEDLKQEL